MRISEIIELETKNSCFPDCEATERGEHCSDHDCNDCDDCNDYCDCDKDDD